MKDRESLGVYVFELKFKTSDTKKPTLEFLKASDLLKAEKGKAFSKLIITIADYKLDQFTGIIKKYGWDETQVLDAGYYNDHSREHVFNGAI